METRTCENCGVEFEGSPQARFHSDACRKAFARRRLEDESLPARQLEEEPEPELEPVTLMSFEGKLLPVVRQSSRSLEQYLAHELAVTKSQIDRGGLRDIEVRGESTMDRSERYLRWRYAGYVTGQIASL